MPRYRSRVRASLAAPNIMLPEYTTTPFSHGQIESKIWLCNELEKLDKKHYSNVYILGCWSGILGLILYSRQQIKFDQLTVVDLVKEHIDYAEKVLDVIRCQTKLNCILGDSNYIVYDTDSLILNVSVDNMLGDDWYRNIPSGSTVVLQSRSGGHDDNINPVETLVELDNKFPMNTTMFLNSLPFEYPVRSYNRHMKIGIK